MEFTGSLWVHSSPEDPRGRLQSPRLWPLEGVRAQALIRHLARAPPPSFLAPLSSSSESEREHSVGVVRSPRPPPLAKAWGHLIGNFPKQGLKQNGCNQKAEEFKLSRASQVTPASASSIGREKALGSSFLASNPSLHTGTLGKLLNLSGPQFPHLYLWKKIVPLTVGPGNSPPRHIPQRIESTTSGAYRCS